MDDMDMNAQDEQPSAATENGENTVTEDQIGTRFGVILLGAPGTGKTTFCNALQEFLSEVVERPHCIINLDPANDNMKYQCDIDVKDLIDLNDVMRAKDDPEEPGLGLGPNGGMIYCIQFLEENIDWLIQQILQKQCRYFLIDMPGQVELFTNHPSLRNIIKKLHQSVGLQCCATHLVDCSYLMDCNKYLSAVTLSMCAKIGFEDVPLINIVSKLDLLQKLGRPQMNLIDLENIAGIHYLFWDGEDDDPNSKPSFNKKYGKLSKSLCELIETYMSHEGYLLLDITSRELICYIIGKIDRANGYFEQPEKVKNPKEAAFYQ